MGRADAAVRVRNADLSADPERLGRQSSGPLQVAVQCGKGRPPRQSGPVAARVPETFRVLDEPAQLADLSGITELEQRGTTQPYALGEQFGTVGGHGGGDQVREQLQPRLGARSPQRIVPGQQRLRPRWYAPPVGPPA